MFGFLQQIQCHSNLVSRLTDHETEARSYVLTTIRYVTQLLAYVKMRPLDGSVKTQHTIAETLSATNTGGSLQTGTLACKMKNGSSHLYMNI